MKECRWEYFGLGYSFGFGKKRSRIRGVPLTPALSRWEREEDGLCLRGKLGGVIAWNDLFARHAEPSPLPLPERERGKIAESGLGLWGRLSGMIAWSDSFARDAERSALGLPEREKILGVAFGAV